MFKPFRSIQNIKGEYDTYYEQLFDFEGNMRGNILSQSGYMVIENNEDRWNCKFASQISAKNHRENIQTAAQNIHVRYAEAHAAENFDGLFQEIVHGDVSIYPQNFFDFISLTNADETDQVEENIQHISYPSHKIHYTSLI